MVSLSIVRTVSISSLLLASLGMVGCSGAAADSESASSESEALSYGRAPTPPNPILAVPEGNKLAFQFDAVGVQIYACQATATGYAWTFTAPEAALFAGNGKLVGKHYVGPTWEYRDGSKVVAAKVAGVSVDPSSIPWLLLQAVSHDGAGKMAKVTYIQRFETAGGNAPTSGCDADHVGAGARVDYTATYYFYEAKSCGHL